MIGLNAKTEPQAMIKAVFALLETFVPLEGRSPMAAIHVLAEMNQGLDLSEFLFKQFMDEYRTIFQRAPMKRYGDKEAALEIGKGGREYPPRHDVEARRWTAADWEMMNANRAARWNGMIRVEIDLRSWSDEFISERFKIELVNLPAVGFRAPSITAEDRVALRVSESNEKLGHQYEAMIEQAITLDRRVAEIAATQSRIEALLTRLITDIYGDEAEQVKAA